MTGIDDFRRESARYFGRELWKRDEDDLRFLRSALDTLPDVLSTGRFVLVPVHSGEDCVSEYLSVALDQIVACDAQLLLLLNGRSGEADFPQRAQLLRDHVAQADDRVAGSVHVLPRVFEAPVTMGRIRGLMCDLACAWSRSLGIERPVVLFNDIDTLAVAKSYFAELFKHAEQSRVTLATGPVLYGFPPSISGDRVLDRHLPELRVFNEMNQAILACARAGEINYERRVWPEGASMAFDLATYCAVGGFDWSLSAGEDDAIGRTMHRYNPGAHGKRPAASIDEIVYEADPEFAPRFAEQAWLVTDPRRVLAAVSRGLSGMEAWANAPFADHLGSTIDSRRLADEYKRNPRRLQERDILVAAGSPGDKLQDDVVRRVFALCLRICSYDRRVRNADQAEMVLSRVGVLAQGCRNQPLAGLRREAWAEAALKDPLSPAIDWNRSSIFRRLFETDGG